MQTIGSLKKAMGNKSRRPEWDWRIEVRGVCVCVCEREREREKSIF